MTEREEPPVFWLLAWGVVWLDIILFQPATSRALPVEEEGGGEGERQLLGRGPRQVLWPLQGRAWEDHQQGGRLQVENISNITNIYQKYFSKGLQCSSV